MITFLSLLAFLFVCFIVIGIIIRFKNVSKVREPKDGDLSCPKSGFENPVDELAIDSQEDGILLRNKREDVSSEPSEANSYLSKGKQAFLQNKFEDAEEFMEKAIMTASKDQDVITLSQARLSLAELNHAMGDLTLACENWQLARELFQELKNEERVNNIEQKMKDTGCPTDWVLNDF